MKDHPKFEVIKSLIADCIKEVTVGYRQVAEGYVNIQAAKYAEKVVAEFVRNEKPETRKICPMMSRPVEQVVQCHGIDYRAVQAEFVDCQKEKCGAYNQCRGD